MLCAEADPEREGDEQKAAENISDGGWEDAPASARLHPGPIPAPAATEKYAIFAGLCWKPAATNNDTARNTGINLSTIVRPIVAKSAASPTSQFASIPDSTA
jgi:hypothetical protein